jgi:hypothetical protein
MSIFKYIINTETILYIFEYFNLILIFFLSATTEVRFYLSFDITINCYSQSKLILNSIFLMYYPRADFFPLLIYFILFII